MTRDEINSLVKQFDPSPFKLFETNGDLVFDCYWNKESEGSSSGLPREVLHYISYFTVAIDMGTGVYLKRGFEIPLNIGKSELFDLMKEEKEHFLEDMKYLYEKIKEIIS